jgi:hypothetical protein
MRFADCDMVVSSGFVFHHCFFVIARSAATKQSIFCGSMDCFAEPVIGRAFARPVGSQ